MTGNCRDSINNKRGKEISKNISQGNLKIKYIFCMCIIHRITQLCIYSFQLQGDMCRKQKFSTR